MSQESSKPDSNAPQVDLSGQRLGDFQLLRRLGRGAMAEVYLAEQNSLGRRVAIKVLKPDLAGNSTYLARFQREAQAAAALVHANIVQIYEVGQRDAYHYIAQEYVEGQNLREWIARQGPPEPAVALSIMLQTAAALAKAGEQGIVHRDIKPENILLTRSGEVKVADFGLARFAREESLDLTQVGVTLGTPLYMSPEQVEGRALDPRSDIYSLGVTYYHMLVGSPPFVGETALGVAVQHLKKAPKALDELRPDLPPAFSRVVHKMLAKEPAARYPSALELLRELRRLQQELFADTWPEELPGCDRFATGLVGQSGPSATRRLEQSMQAVAVYAAAAPRRRPWLWALAYAASFAIGLTVARFTADAAILPTKAAPRFASRQPTALAQVYLACQLGTEDAWKSVEKYYPTSVSLVRRAKQQLARLYLRESRYDEAMAIFEQFASAGPNDEYRAFGLAGKAAILTLRKQYRESASVLETLWPIRDRLRDAQMQQLVQTVLRKNRAEVGPNPSHAEWQKWLDDRFGEPD